MMVPAKNAPTEDPIIALLPTGQLDELLVPVSVATYVTVAVSAIPVEFE
jgi:hypothetical protein